MSPNSRLTVCCVRPAINGSVYVLTRRIARSRGTHTARAASRRKREYPTMLGSLLMTVGGILTQFISAKVSNLDDRSSLFLTDPQVREFDGKRALCKICDTWVSLGTEDDTRARQTWLDHRNQCLQSRKTPVNNSHPLPASNSSKFVRRRQFMND